MAVKKGSGYSLSLSNVVESIEISYGAYVAELVNSADSRSNARNSIVRRKHDNYMQHRYLYAVG
jgi:hypothetical protein